MPDTNTLKPQNEHIAQRLQSNLIAWFISVREDGRASLSGSSGMAHILSYSANQKTRKSKIFATTPMSSSPSTIPEKVAVMS
jgi:hypothetical protein